MRPGIKRKIKVGILDSGIDPDKLLKVMAIPARCFNIDRRGRIYESNLTGDELGHGTLVANQIIARSNSIDLLSAKIFAAGNTTTASQAAVGLDWLNKQGAEVVNMSLGLKTDRRVLREACHKAVNAGMILIASTPARGPAVYPACYPGIIRVTGDARCSPGEISFLDSERHDFGACPRPSSDVSGAASHAGASIACACVTATITDYLAAGGDRHTLYDYLERISSYRGPERR